MSSDEERARRRLTTGELFGDLKLPEPDSAGEIDDEDDPSLVPFMDDDAGVITRVTRLDTVHQRLIERIESESGLERQQALEDARAVLEQEAAFVEKRDAEDTWDENRDQMLDAYFKLQRAIDAAGGKSSPVLAERAKAEEQKAAAPAKKTAAKKTAARKPLSRATRMGIVFVVLVVARGGYCVFFELDGGPPNVPKGPQQVQAGSSAIMVNHSPPKADAPKLDLVQLDQTGDGLVLMAMGSDPQGEALAFEITWYENGKLKTVKSAKAPAGEGQVNVTLPAASLTKGGRYEAAVQVSDGKNASVSMRTAPVVFGGGTPQKKAPAR